MTALFLASFESIPVDESPQTLASWHWRVSNTRANSRKFVTRVLRRLRSCQVQQSEEACQMPLRCPLVGGAASRGALQKSAAKLSSKTLSVASAIARHYAP